MNILDKIVAVKKKEVHRQQESISLAELQERVQGLPRGRDFKKAISSGDSAIIAEVKKHSPSAGSIREDLDHCALALAYEKNGAAAISVLTDREFFHGSTAYLREIKKALGIPVLRKDFLIDPYQIYETKLMGADAVLLIAGLLEEDKLREYLELTRSLGIWPLVEVHSREELQQALAAGADIIGINNRDLKTFVTDLKTTRELAPLVPPQKLVVSESGIKARGDVEALQKMGVHAFLIGEALMCAADPGLKLRELLGKGGS